MRDTFWGDRMNDKKPIDNILNQIRCFAEEYKKEMSVNVYEGLYNMMQGIEHDFKD